MISLKKLSVFIVCLIASGFTLAETCKYSTIERSHPMGQYLDNGDGTVTDIVNGLMWQKCSIGQTYNGSECAGTPSSYNEWSEALLVAEENISFASFDDWRMPNIKELGSLVERACHSPAIDLEYFPSTPLAIYWSNTPDKARTNDFLSIDAKFIDFTTGTEYATDPAKLRLVRMVRDLKVPTQI